MKKKEFKNMLETMAQAWSNRDYEKVSEYFAEKLFYSDSLNYSFKSKREILDFFKDDEGFSQNCIFHNVVFDEETQIGTGEYTYRGTFCYHGTAWIKIEDEKIVEWREYQHVSEKNYDDYWSKI
ncbi:MAG TPA: nuclear transport factor 2 family protein [Pyrinomonadaceae bacterium]|nr:nuclear transport factor 2 family protein [Pyrinomonadaceae bacterium]